MQYTNINKTNKNDSRSAELFARAQQLAPGGVHSPVRAFRSVGGTPVFFQRGQGAELFSVDGERYIDFCQSFGPLILGHADSEVKAQVAAGLENAWSFGACEPYSLQLAEWIVARCPWVEKLRFVSSGTEAVMSALRVARGATGRRRIVKFDGCYHGHADSLLVKAGSGLAQGTTAADSAGVSQAVAEETLVAPLDDEAAFSEILDRWGTEIAAVIIEPLPANFGLLQQRKEFLQHVVHETHRVGALLIFDEVISGFRIGMGGMAEYLDVKPDLVTYGKVIGGGFPVGAYAGRRELMDWVAPLGPVYQAGTLSANPIGMLAGLATLKKAERVDLHAVLRQRTLSFTHKLQQILMDEGLNLHVTSHDSIFWIYAPSSINASSPRAVTQIPTQQAQMYKIFFHAALECGVYFAPSTYEVGFLGWAHTESILDEALLLLQKAARMTATKLKL